MGGEPGRRDRDPPSRCPGSLPNDRTATPHQHRGVVPPSPLTRCSGFEARETGKKPFTTRGVHMYIGIGTVVVILLIVLIIYFLRRA